MAIHKRKRYKKGERVDMRQGGRVRLHGGTHTPPDPPTTKKWSPHNPDRPNHSWEDIPANAPVSPIDTSIPVPYGQTTTEQSDLARQQVADAATGVVPEAAKIPDPQALQKGIPTGFSFEPIEGVEYEPDPPPRPDDPRISPRREGESAAAYAKRRPPKDIKEEPFRWAYGPDGQKIKVAIDTQDYEADATLMADDTTKAVAGTVADVDAETVTKQTEAEAAEEQDAKAITEAAYERIYDEDVDVETATINKDNAYIASVTEIRNLTEKFKAQGMPDEDAVEAAKAQVISFITRDEATAPILDRLNKVTVVEAVGPVAETREGQVITAEEEADILSRVTKEGTNLEDLGTYQKAAEREAQVGEAKTKTAEQLPSDVPSKDADQREGITGTAPQGDASQIGGVPTHAAASMQAVTNSEERTAAAQDMLAVVGDVPPDIAEAISQNPEALTAELDEAADPNNVAAIASLPQEALVSVQMESLLAGIESGVTPVWARPAVDAVNQMMAQRGLSVSTVGRDALFNVIIERAYPIALNNAQALQARAQQNLSFEQQGNLAQSQQIMQIRMENLSNKNVAAAQTASMAQQIKIQQGTFEQQAVITTAEQRQQTRVQETQGEQQRQAQISAQKQQAAISTFSADIQKDLADLQYLNIAAKEDMTADQQIRLTEYNAKIAKVMRQADLEQEMKVAQLSTDLQVELKNLTEMNATDRESMSEENKVRLANLSVLVDWSKTNANLAQQMKLANMTNEQQMEMAMLSDRAATDTANFTVDNQFRLEELETTARILSENSELRTRAELAQLGASEKVALANLTAKNQADSESMNATNIADLARYDKQMNAAQLNAQLAQQLGLAQLSNDQETSLFNAQVNANIDMAEYSFEQQKSLADSKFMQTMTLQDFSQRHQGAMQDATAMASLDMAAADQRTKLAITNAQNFLQMDMKNMDAEQQSFIMEAQIRQQALLSDQAAFNASEQFNATSQNQLDQYMTGLAQQIELTNKTRNDAMQQFNATQDNAAEARRAGNEARANMLEAQLQTDVSKFNDQQDFNREQFNVTQSNAIEQFNVNWRRDANKIDTAATNAVNQQNAQNAFGLSTQAMSFMWQELRDQMDYSFKTYDNDQQRKASLIVAALGNEGATSGDDGWGSTFEGWTSLFGNFLETSGGD
jgi:hypothetical protein